MDPPRAAQVAAQEPAAPPVLTRSHFSKDPSGSITEDDLQRVLESPIDLQFPARVGVVPLAEAFDARAKPSIATRGTASHDLASSLAIGPIMRLPSTRRTSRPLPPAGEACASSRAMHRPRKVDKLWSRPERSEWFGGGYDYPGIHSICVDPRNSRHVTIAISCGGVWQSRDDGASWNLAARGMGAEYMPPERRDDENIQDPHRMVQSPTRPDVLWVQHHNGVYRSTDGAASWHEIGAIAPAKFGFAVAVHPREPNTAWFVPAVKDECRVPVDGKLAVARTRDGGKTFSVLRRGLPQEHAYDLVYRHGLDIETSGNRLAMGSTTGGLWISEDQGDSWRCVSTQLPPVYAVRFG
jgi:hypothetical protein